MEDKINTYCVYAHYSKNGKKLLYIGCSKNKRRPYDFKARSKELKEAYVKYGVKVKIIEDNMHKGNALHLEFVLICKYGIKKHGGILYNKGYK